MDASFFILIADTESAYPLPHPLVAPSKSSSATPAQIPLRGTGRDPVRALHSHLTKAAQATTRAQNPFIRYAIR